MSKPAKATGSKKPAPKPNAPGVIKPGKPTGSGIHIPKPTGAIAGRGGIVSGNAYGISKPYWSGPPPSPGSPEYKIWLQSQGGGIDVNGGQGPAAGNPGAPGTPGVPPPGQVVIPPPPSTMGMQKNAVASPLEKLMQAPATVGQTLPGAGAVGAAYQPPTMPSIPMLAATAPTQPKVQTMGTPSPGMGGAAAPGSPTVTDDPMIHQYSGPYRIYQKTLAGGGTQLSFADWLAKDPVGSSMKAQADQAGTAVSAAAGNKTGVMAQAVGSGPQVTQVAPMAPPAPINVPKPPVAMQTGIVSSQAAPSAMGSIMKPPANAPQTQAATPAAPSPNPTQPQPAAVAGTIK